jgi:pilus assembly protein CpaE
MGWEISVQFRIRSPKVAGDLKKIVSSLDGFYLKESESLQTGDLLIFEMGNNPQEDIRSLYALSRSGKIKEIFLISSSWDPEILNQARKAGAKKIFVQPFKKEEIIAALLGYQNKKSRASPSPKYQKFGKIIFVLGCKGGVGTTTVSLNLAASLAHLDKSRSVLLTDLSAPFGDMPLLLNLGHLPDWAQVMKNLPRINLNNLKTVLGKHPSGFYVLPSPPGLEGVENHLEAVEEVLSLMEKTFEFLVVDGGKSTRELSSKVFSMADAVLLITNLSHPCMENVKRLFPFFRELGPYREDKVRIVVNRYARNSPISTEDAEKEWKSHVFWTIPNDYAAVMEAAKQGKTLVEMGKEKEIRKSFLKLAAFFLMEDSSGGEKQHFWSKLVDKKRWAKLTLQLSYKLKTS